MFLYCEVIFGANKTWIFAPGAILFSFSSLNECFPSWETHNFEAFKSKSKASDDLSVKKSIVRLIWTKNTFSGENWTSPTSEMASQKNIFWTKKSFHRLNQLNKYKSKILWSNLSLDKREGTRTSRHLEISSVRWQLPMISTSCPSQIYSFKNKNII